MRRTAAVVTTLVVLLLNLVGFADPADAAPTPAPAGCELKATPTVSGNGVTSSILLEFDLFGVNMIIPPAWSYSIRADSTQTVIKTESFGLNNSQQDTVDTRGWTAGFYTALANFGEEFPSCTTTFEVHGLDSEPVDLPPTAVVDCGQDEVVVGTTIIVKGTAHDDHGIDTETIRLPDGSEQLGNTVTWTAEAEGDVAFAYFAVDTAGHHANDLCRTSVVAPPQAQPEPTVSAGTPTLDDDPSPTPVPTSTPDTESETDRDSASAASEASGTEGRGDTKSSDETTNNDETEADDTTSDIQLDATDETSTAPEPTTTDEPVDAHDVDVEDDDDVTVGAAVTNAAAEIAAPSTAVAPNDAVAELLEILTTAQAHEVAVPVAAPLNGQAGIYIPWWFLGLIAALGAVLILGKRAPY